MANLGPRVTAHAGFRQSQASHSRAVLQSGQETEWRLRHDIATQHGVAAALRHDEVALCLAELGPLASRHAGWRQSPACRPPVVIGEEARSRLRVVVAMRGNRITATLGPRVMHRVGLSAVVSPLLFGHAPGLQGPTCRPAITVGEEPGGADGLSLPGWSEQQQSLKGKQNKKVSWGHGLGGLVWNGWFGKRRNVLSRYPQDR